MTTASSVVVLCEVDALTGALDEVSLEALAAARALAASADDSAVTAAVVGAVAEQQTTAAVLGTHGVARVEHLTGDALAAFGGAAWAAALIDLRSRTGAEVVMAGGTARGNEVMAHLATELDVPMAANVVAVAERSASTTPLTVYRQVAGGSAIEEMLLDTTPAVLTVAGHAWDPEPRPDAVPASWSSTTPTIAPAARAAQVVRTSDPEPDESQALTAAKVVVGAGRGAGGPDGFGPVSELADLLGGAVGVTRVVTSLGWRPHHEQVGQTGSRIAPDVYIACGISGAIQHWAGCASSRTIIAINTDPEAPMMTRATYAVVGDMHEVVPAIVEELRAR